MQGRLCAGLSMEMTWPFGNFDHYLRGNMAGSKPLDTDLLKRKELFWEISPERIPQALVENDDWVIVRVFEYGQVDDIFNVIELYGEEKVKAVLSTENLKPVAAVMAYLFLNVDRYGKYNN